MRQVEIPGTGESLPVVGFGTYHLLDRVDEDMAAKAIKVARSMGLNFIDTSDNYMNEGFIGEVIAEWGVPEDYFVATKTGLATTYEEFTEMKRQGRSANTSPERVRTQILNSTAALGGRVIDLYQVHAYDEKTPAAYVAQKMHELLEAGHIRYYGVCNYTSDELEELLTACDRLRVPRPTTTQPYLNLLSTHAVDQGVEVAREEGLLVLAHSPLMKGFLADRFVDAFDAMLERERKDDAITEDFLNKIQEANNEVQRLRAYANANGYTLSEYALAWLINQPGTVAINACVKPDHLVSTLKATEWEIDDAGLSLAEEVRTNPIVIESAAVMHSTANASKPYYAKRSK